MSCSRLPFPLPQKAAIAPLAQSMFQLIDEHEQEFLPER